MCLHLTLMKLPLALKSSLPLLCVLEYILDLISDVFSGMRLTLRALDRPAIPCKAVKVC